MKKLLALFLAAISVVTVLITSVGAVDITDSQGTIYGNAVLTHSRYVYTLEVTSRADGGSVYGRIYLYDSGRNTIDGGWDSGYDELSITYGEAGVRPYYKSIWAKAQGVQYTYYDEY